MGKNKLQKFADLRTLPNVLQCPFMEWQQGGWVHAGAWAEEIFRNDHPLTLELGCGRGEYTLGLARRYPDRNFVGIDIKGNRIWNGATQAHREGLDNVRFLRTEIELLPHLFAPEEVDEIWITFPDPQMKKVRKRLTSVAFLQRYRQILRPEGTVRLKTDSRFLYLFTKAVIAHNGLRMLKDLSDIYAEAPQESILRSIQTYYESQWLGRGISIKFLEFDLALLTPGAEDPQIKIEQDPYRSYGRQGRSALCL